MDFPKQYSPKDFESALYEEWKASGSFEPHTGSTGKTFYIPIPPPNVTGNLHIGHALAFTLEDIMARYHRMKGDETLWVPGTDHAGIATQAKVEERLARAGRNKSDMTREDFVAECWKWMDEYRANISGQIERMGASVAWTTERFTFDDKSNSLVEDIFVDLYNKGLIYRGEYMVNYSPELDSVISDIEVEHRELEEKMYYINYFVSGSDSELMVATTRPETLLADLAVAVHPKDKRYKKLIGKSVILPIVNKEIPIIADEMVDMTFGTGVVKITPAHDPADFETARRHGLPTNYRVLDKKGYMTSEAGMFSGQYGSTEARNNIVELLRAKGNLVKVEPYTHKVGFCSRGNCRVESVVSTQWFVRANVMAEKVIKGYKKNDFVIIPDRFGKVFEDWIYNLRDWCVSRQLWWGHQIPAYFDTETGELLGVARNPAEIIKRQCKKYKLKFDFRHHEEGSKTEQRGDPGSDGLLPSSQGQENRNDETDLSMFFMRRDTDVLDTWFSSGIWPFSVLDFTLEDSGKFFSKYYPADVLETGHDILFFWVIRMLLFGYEYTGDTPFRTIYLHGLVLNENGKKMSKSSGSIIDPLSVIEKYSADALRLALTLGNTPGNNLNFSMKAVEEQSLFLNKLWNIARFVSMNVGEITMTDSELLQRLQNNKKSLLPYERWILSRLSKLIERSTEGMEKFNFSTTGSELMAFIRDEFADFAIEAYKLEKDRSKYGKELMSYILLTLLKLSHPFIPFITEALFGYISGDNMLITAPWPQGGWKRDQGLEEEMTILFDLVRSIRNLRAESKIKPGDERAVYLVGNISENMEENESLLQGLTRTSELRLREKPEDSSLYAYATLHGIEIYVDAAIDEGKRAQERERLLTDIQDQKEYLRGISQKLMNPSFTANAPEKVVRAEMDKQKLVEEQITKLETKYKSML